MVSFLYKMLSPKLGISLLFYSFLLLLHGNLLHALFPAIQKTSHFIGLGLDVVVLVLPITYSISAQYARTHYDYGKIYS